MQNAQLYSSCVPSVQPTMVGIALGCVFGCMKAVMLVGQRDALL